MRQGAKYSLFLQRETVQSLPPPFPFKPSNKEAASALTDRKDDQCASCVRRMRTAASSDDSTVCVGVTVTCAHTTRLTTDETASLAQTVIHLPHWRGIDHRTEDWMSDR